VALTLSLPQSNSPVARHRHRFEAASHLKARVRELSAQFLLTGLHAGLALLDVAETSASDDANQQRRALALEAYEVVADRLSRSFTAVPLTADERAEISQLHRELGARLGR
jgi:hypothetical protein